MNEQLKESYNDRLFNKKTFRGRFHLARYYWLQDEITTLGLNAGGD